MSRVTWLPQWSRVMYVAIQNVAKSAARNRIRIGIGRDPWTTIDLAMRERGVSASTIRRTLDRAVGLGIYRVSKGDFYTYQAAHDLDALDFTGWNLISLEVYSHIVERIVDALMSEWLDSATDWAKRLDACNQQIRSAS